MDEYIGWIHSFIGIIIYHHDWTWNWYCCSTTYVPYYKNDNINENEKQQQEQFQQQQE